MQKKKALLAASAIALVAVFLIGGSIAWLTDQDSMTNKVKIAEVGTTPDEPHWPDPDNPVPVSPGTPQAKDPTVTVDAGSDPVYVRVLVRIDTKLLSLMTPAESITFTGVDKKGDTFEINGSALPTANSPWVKNGNGTVDGGYTYLEYRYPLTVDGFNDSGEAEAYTISEPAFTGFKLNELADTNDFEDVDDMNIVVVSQCIQATGQTDADTAFANLGPVIDAFD